MPDLIYIGPGFLLDVPARDLSADEALYYGRAYLLASGLYVEAAPPVAKQPAVKEPSDDLRD